MSSTISVVTDEKRHQFRQEGYFLLPSVLAESDVELLRSGADYSIAKADAEMDALGVDTLNINTRGRRYFSNKVAQEKRELRGFLFGELMADICRAAIGDTAYLFNEQYVIKCAERRSPGIKTAAISTSGTSRTSPVGLRSTTSTRPTGRSTSFRTRSRGSAPTCAMFGTPTSTTWSDTSTPHSEFQSRHRRGASSVSAASCFIAVAPT